MILPCFYTLHFYRGGEKLDILPRMSHPQIGRSLNSNSFPYNMFQVSILSKNIQNEALLAYFNEYIGIEYSSTTNIVDCVC